MYVVTLKLNSLYGFVMDVYFLIVGLRVLLICKSIRSRYETT